MYGASKLSGQHDFMTNICRFKMRLVCCFLNGQNVLRNCQQQQQLFNHAAFTGGGRKTLAVIMLHARCYCQRR